MKRAKVRLLIHLVSEPAVCALKSESLATLACLSSSFRRGLRPWAPKSPKTGAIYCSASWMWPLWTKSIARPQCSGNYSDLRLFGWGSVLYSIRDKLRYLPACTHAPRHLFCCYSCLWSRRISESKVSPRLPAKCTFIAQRCRVGRLSLDCQLIRIAWEWIAFSGSGPFKSSSGKPWSDT